MLTLAALLSAAIITPTQPAPSGAPQMIVHAEDLNLRSASDAAELRHRVDQAVLIMAQGEDTITGSILERWEVAEAQAKARQQADKIIAAANKPALDGE